MILLIIGDAANESEVRAKFGHMHQYLLAGRHSDAIHLLTQCDVVFDFTIAQHPVQITTYSNVASPVIFLNSVMTTLERLFRRMDTKSDFIFGFNGMATFFNRGILEVTLVRDEQQFKLEEVCKKLDSAFQRVKDTVGMVTPRVICMMINEAYYTLEEGTASREDIDLAMKLGTNYPYGPFEWCQRIGAREVGELLNAVYRDTQDDRYKICTLLQKEANEA